jgi:predicted RNase H-related nuclease YkuK (DUF458 family)
MLGVRTSLRLPESFPPTCENIVSKLINEAELREFMSRPNIGPDTKIYFGADSSRFKNNGKWFADYTVVCVVHINGLHGCKIFAETHREADTDNVARRPFNRMMCEAKYVAQLHNRFKDVFEDYEIYVHLDISPRKTNGSSVASAAAVGYVQAMCNVVPILKPCAYAASYAADRAPDLGLMNGVVQEAQGA